MNWLPLTSENQLQEIITNSFNSKVKAVLIFKHSTRCSISLMALNRLESKWKFPQEDVPVYFLDLLKFPLISSKIVELFNIQHESPQILLIKNGQSIYNASHSAILFSEIEAELA